MKERLRNKKWYPYTVAACIAVTFYVILNNLGSISAGLGTFFGYFRAVVIGIVLAYIMNPMASMLDRRLFNKIKNKKLAWNLSIGLTVIMLLLIIAFILYILVPQLVESFGALVSNMDEYVDSFQKLLAKWDLEDKFNIAGILSSSENLLQGIQTFFGDNINNVVNASAAAGKSIFSWVIAMILSVYLLSSRDNIKTDLIKIFRRFTPEKKYEDVMSFLTRCDEILVKYIVSDLLDAVIIGVANAILMACFGMQYVGLISIVMAVTNLIPTIGPVIGGAIGAFILLLIRPSHALIFIIFTFVLQFIDSYVIKPKLFGNSLGVSGLLILISIIVFGNMFGIVGVLLAIPLAAILDFAYRDVLKPIIENKPGETDRTKIINE